MSKSYVKRPYVRSSWHLVNFYHLNGKLFFKNTIAFCFIPCLHGGTCIAFNRCSCVPGYTGRQCLTREFSR